MREQHPTVSARLMMSKLSRAVHIRASDQLLGFTAHQTVYIFREVQIPVELQCCKCQVRAVLHTTAASLLVVMPEFCAFPESRTHKVMQRQTLYVGETDTAAGVRTYQVAQHRQHQEARQQVAVDLPHNVLLTNFAACRSNHLISVVRTQHCTTQNLTTLCS